MGADTDNLAALGKLSPGLRKTLTKNGVRSVCKCGFLTPKYVGRYMSRCPLCGEPIKADDNGPDPSTMQTGDVAGSAPSEV